MKSNMSENKTKPFVQQTSFGCPLPIDHPIVGPNAPKNARENRSASFLGWPQNVCPRCVATNINQNMVTPLVQITGLSSNPEKRNFNRNIDGRACLLTRALINRTGLVFVDGVVTLEFPIGAR